MISIVIPTYNNYDLLHQRIMEIYQYCPKETKVVLNGEKSTQKYEYEIVVMDDCSPEYETSQGVNWWKKIDDLNVRYYRNRENLGFPKNCNLGIRLAKGEIVVLLSTDVQIQGDFLMEISNEIGKHPNALVGGRLLDYNTGWNVIDLGDVKILAPYLEGWLLAAKRSSWHRLRGFDEGFYRFDFEDVDLSLRAFHEFDMPLIPLNLPYLHHISGATINKFVQDRESITRQNQTYFQEKWSKYFGNKA